MGKRSVDPAGIFSDFSTNRACLDTCTIPFCRVFKDPLSISLLQTLYQHNCTNGIAIEDIHLFSLSEINNLLINNHKIKLDHRRLLRIIQDVVNNSAILLTIHPDTKIKKEYRNSTRFCFNPVLLKSIRNSFSVDRRFSLLCPIGISAFHFRIVDYLAEVHSATVTDLQAQFHFSRSFIYDSIRFLEMLGLINKVQSNNLRNNCKNHSYTLNKNHFLFNTVPSKHSQSDLRESNR